MAEVKYSIAIVSHNQGDLVNGLLMSIAQTTSEENYEIIIIENTIEGNHSYLKKIPIRANLITNQQEIGLAANINHALRISKGKYFCTLNPDIIFTDDILDCLVEEMEEHSLSFIAPLMVDEHMDVQDSFRNLPGLFSLTKRYFSEPKAYSYEEVISIGKMIFPDWIAGMFILFKRNDLIKLSGYNEKYRLYFEDVDLCCRAHLKNLKFGVTTEYSVVHNAQRNSRKSLKYTLMHVASALRFFLTRDYWKVRRIIQKNEKF